LLLISLACCPKALFNQLTIHQIHTKRIIPDVFFQDHHRERIFTSTRTSDLLQVDGECQTVRNMKMNKIAQRICSNPVQNGLEHFYKYSV